MLQKLPHGKRCNTDENISEQRASYEKKQIVWMKVFSFKYNMIISKGFKRKIYNILNKFLC